MVDGLEKEFKPMLAVNTNNGGRKSTDQWVENSTTYVFE
jgi:hypothetical protein